MKRLAVILGVVLLPVFSLWQSDKKRRNKKIDNGITGPRGERIFIGSGGGLYFIRDDSKSMWGLKRKKLGGKTLLTLILLTGWNISYLPEKILV